MEKFKNRPLKERKQQKNKSKPMMINNQFYFIRLAFKVNEPETSSLSRHIKRRQTKPTQFLILNACSSSSGSNPFTRLYILARTWTYSTSTEVTTFPFLARINHSLICYKTRTSRVTQESFIFKTESFLMLCTIMVFNKWGWLWTHT